MPEARNILLRTASGNAWRQPKKAGFKRWVTEVLLSKVLKFISNYCILWMLYMEPQNLMFQIEFHLCLVWSLLAILLLFCFRKAKLNLLDYIMKVYNLINDHSKEIFCLFISEQILGDSKCTRTMADNSLGDGLSAFLVIMWLWASRS